MPLLAVEQGAVGLPNVVNRNLGIVTGANHADELLTAHGGVEQIAVVPTAIVRTDGEQILCLALLRGNGIGGHMHIVLSGIGEVDLVGQVVGILNVVAEEGSLGRRRRWCEAVYQFVDGNLVE